MTHFFRDAFEARLVNVIQANVWREVKHGRRLRHVRTDHPGSTDDGQLFIRKEIHIALIKM